MLNKYNYKMNIKPIVKLKSQEVTYSLIKGRNVLGRNAQMCSIIINHQSISNQHCEIIINEHNREMFIKDLNSRNGTFVNGKRLQQQLNVVLKENDVLRFGKDHTMYKVEYIPFSLNDKIQFTIEDDVAMNHTNNNNYSKTSIDHLNRKLLIQNQNVNEQHNEEYEMIHYKHNALMKYASDLQKQNDALKEENQRLSEIIMIKERENTDMNNKLDSDENIIQLKEKEKVIDILRAELFYTQHELQRMSQLKGIDSDYVNESVTLRKIVQQYKNIIDNMNMKWNDIVNENERLKTEIKYCRSLIDNINQTANVLVGQHDETIKTFLLKVKSSLNNFNKDTGGYLLEQVKGVINDKENALKQVISMSIRNKQLEYFNNQLTQNITQLNEQIQQRVELGNVQNVIKQLQDKITLMQMCYSPEKVAQLEQMIAKLTVGVDVNVNTNANINTNKQNYNVQYINNNDNIDKNNKDISSVKQEINVNNDIQQLKDTLQKEVSDPDMQKYINKQDSNINISNNVNEQSINNNLEEIKSISSRIDNSNI